MIKIDSKNIGWIAMVIMFALLIIGYIVGHFISSSKFSRKRQIIPDTIEGIGAFCMILVRWIPRTVFVRLPMWLGLPIIVNAIVAILCIIVVVAKPFFQEVFGANQDKPDK